jgi:hypothetical protein
VGAGGWGDDGEFVALGDLPDELVEEGGGADGVAAVFHADVYGKRYG